MKEKKTFGQSFDHLRHLIAYMNRENIQKDDVVGIIEEGGQFVLIYQK